MSCYNQGLGLFGAGSSAGVMAGLMSLGALDAFLIKGAQCTYFRFRYCRHTNFAMDAVGQPFNSTPVFGGNSQISLNRVGDLLYYMYVVIDLPGICAVRRPGQSCGAYGSCGIPTSQFPSYNDNNCDPCATGDAAVYRAYAGAYDGVSDAYGQEGLEVGKAEYMKRNYGACYNPENCGMEEADSCPSVPTGDRPWCHWANAIGQLLVRRAILVVGGHQSDILYSDYLYMWEELAGQAGKRLREMIGKRKSRKALIKDSQQEQRFYVPLPWYFCQTSGNALPLCTLQFHGVQVHIEWERLCKCVVVSHSDVEVYKCCDGSKLTNNDLQAWLDTTYIYLDIEERNRFSLANFDQLMTQTQMLSVTATSNCVIVPITFNHPVIQLIWAVRRKCNELKNQHFNYSGIDGRDPIQEVSLRLNNLNRFSGREGRYYRLVVPYQCMNSIPKAYVYTYSFALFPCDPNPSGSLNMSRIDNIDMTFNLQDGLGREQCTIIIFARNWNVMRFTEGIGGPLFNN